jgi:tripartite-type tricarboxylate transporter receptor subunit TctC
LVDKIAGAKPADLRVEQPTKFDLVVNLIVAKPPTPLACADEVIEGREGRFKMKLPRRQVLRLAAGAAALPAVSRFAFAQAYPSRPVRLIVGFPAGGGADTLARLTAQWLSERLGQPFIVENRPGAASNIATEAVVHAPADGYTLLFVGAPNAINATLYDRLSFNFIRDIAPVAGIARQAFVLLVNPSLPAKTFLEFLAYAKANPAKVNMASSGSGTTSHIAGELFKMIAGVNMLHVPYRGDVPAITDLLGGQVQVYFGTLSGSIEYIRSGKLRALAVTTATRSEVLPDIPTVGEFVPGYEASTWSGIGAPKATPAEIVDKLNRKINAGLADPKIKARLADLGSTPLVGSPADFGKFISDETDKWGKVVKFVGIKAD